uniref:Uncharacterized protein n=1 Tax=Panagrolaimus davidi TaxID=227884 RepID=A0A914QE80_9BILA
MKKVGALIFPIWTTNDSVWWPIIFTLVAYSVIYFITAYVNSGFIVYVIIGMLVTFMASACSTFMYYPRTPLEERKQTFWVQFGMFVVISAIIYINFELSDYKHCSETERYMYNDHETTVQYHYTALEDFFGTDQIHLLINSGKKKIVIELPNKDSLNRKRHSL